MSFLDTFETIALDVLFRSQSGQIPTNWYAGLSTTTPSDNGTNISEPSGGAGYARVLVPSWASASSGSIANNTDLIFPLVTSTWGTLTHVVLFDALTSGTPLVSLELTDGVGTPTPVLVPVNNNFTIASGALVINLA